MTQHVIPCLISSGNRVEDTAALLWIIFRQVSSKNVNHSAIHCASEILNAVAGIALRAAVALKAGTAKKQLAELARLADVD